VHAGGRSPDRSKQRASVTPLDTAQGPARRSPGVAHASVALPLVGALCVFAWLALAVWSASPWRRLLDHGGWSDLAWLAALCRAVPAGDVVVPALAYALAWLLMIAAMMLPTTLPLLALFRRIVASRSDAGALVMGYYDGSKLPMWKWAREYTLADNFFMAAFGGSYLNHVWLICACTPIDDHAPAGARAQVDERGWLKTKGPADASVMKAPAEFLGGETTPDGFSVNTTQPPYQPSRIPPAKGGDPRYADPARHTLPPQKLKTIGDTLSAKGVSWVWYSGAWDDAIKDGMQAPDAKRVIINYREKGAPNFVTHHQPFNYFERFAPGTADRERHLKDYKDLVAAIDKGDLPQVAFYKPQGNLNQHPGYADVLSGDEHVAALIAKIKASPLWNSTAIIVTYDENGGFWDHVAPPKGDRWGPGSRIPAIVVSPYARRGFVDHTYYDTTSILKLITRRFDLEPLPGVRAGAGDLTAAFQL